MVSIAAHPATRYAATPGPTRSGAIPFARSRTSLARLWEVVRARWTMIGRVPLVAAMCSPAHPGIWLTTRDSLVSELPVGTDPAGADGGQFKPRRKPARSGRPFAPGPIGIPGYKAITVLRIAFLNTKDWGLVVLCPSVFLYKVCSCFNHVLFSGYNCIFFLEPMTHVVSSKRLTVSQLNSFTTGQLDEV